MALDALLLSRDPSLLQLMRRLLDDLGIRSQVCSSSAAAQNLLHGTKFEAVVVDCDDLAGGNDLLRSLRLLPTNRNSIVFAVINGATGVRSAFEMGANFVLEKPVTAERAARNLKAAHGLMVRERRRFTRRPLDVQVLLKVGDGPEVRARATDISESGIGLFALTALDPGASLRFRMVLPGNEAWLEGKAQVVWSSPQVGCGLQILTMRNELRVQLARWLAQRIEQEHLEAVYS